MNCDFGLQNSAYVIENLASEEGSLEDVLGLPGAYLLVWIEFISSCLSMPWVFPEPSCVLVCVCVTRPGASWRCPCACVARRGDP
jgi:hypothetical protein